MQTPVRVGLVQFSVQYQGHQFFPYSAGALQAYAQQHLPEPEQFHFIPPVFLPAPPAEVAHELKTLDIVGFSVYIWNIKRSLATAEHLKRLRPDILIIFGGPQVPDQAEAFLRQHPWINVCCHGAGEEVFTALLTQGKDGNWHELHGISYLTPTGEYRQNPPAPRTRNLDNHPSPYSRDIFRPLLQKYPHLHWIAPWETNRGCPFSCTYCDWGSAIASKIILFQAEQLYQDLEWFGRHKIGMIFCCDANFGILKRDLEITDYIGRVFAQKGYPHTFHQQTAKNSAERTWELHRIFAAYGVKTEVTLSLQSMDSHTLQQIKRDNISQTVFLKLQQRFHRAGIPTYTDVILGLPGESYASFTEGISEMIANGQHSRMQFYQAIILPNAEMAQTAYRQQHGLETVFLPLASEHISSDIHEEAEMVIATHTMPRSDWRKSRIFAWMCKMLYFIDKPLQVPILLLNTCAQVSFRTIIEAFMHPTAQANPLFTSIQNFFEHNAQALQQGIADTSLYSLPDASGRQIPLPPEQYLLQTIARQDLIPLFYQEAARILLRCLPEHQTALTAEILLEALRFNAALFKTSFKTESERQSLPCHQETFNFYLHWNIPEVYQAILRGEPWSLQHVTSHFSKDWQGPPFVLNRHIVA
jgi:radical SAM superfamily enzyme YgiQ (UPF0313 family)